MKNYFALLFIAVLLPASLKAANEELEFKLEDDQKLIGTFSGDFDQNSSVHLAIIKDKNTNEFKLRPFFINKQLRITSFQDIIVKEEPSVISYHFNPVASKITLLVKQGQKNDIQLEIIDLNTQTKAVSRQSVQDYEDTYLTIRATDRTFLIYKEKDRLFKERNALEIKTIYDSHKQFEVNFNFNGANKDLFRKIFEIKPQTINTNELVENGSINLSKVYYYNDKLFFDHTNEDGYTLLAIDPERESGISFMEFGLEGAGKIKEIGSYIYGSKVFLFINDKKDIKLRSYELGSGDLIADVQLKEKLSGTIDLESFEKIIKKSSRNRYSLTGTVNEGPENTMVITLDYVVTNNYNYHYNWWWHHQFMQQQMMWQHQMMQQHIRMQTQINSFGPNPDVYFSEEFVENKTQSVQFVIDKDFNFLKNNDITPVRPKINKDKHVEKYQKDRHIKDVTLAFTRQSGRAIYFSKTTDTVHITSFEL